MLSMLQCLVSTKDTVSLSYLEEVMKENHQGGAGEELCHEKRAPLHLWASVKWAKRRQDWCFAETILKGCFRGSTTCDSNTIFKIKSIIQ